MKKIFILFLVLTIILLNKVNINKQFSFRNYFKSGVINTYSKTINSNKNDILPNVTVTNNKSQKIIGESISWTDFEVNHLLEILSAKVEWTEYLKDKDLLVIYCKTPKIKKTVQVNGHNINLQIATCENYTVAGWPMILGAF